MAWVELVPTRLCPRRWVKNTAVKSSKDGPGFSAPRTIAMLFSKTLCWIFQEFWEVPNQEVVHRKSFLFPTNSVRVVCDRTSSKRNPGKRDENHGEFLGYISTVDTNKVLAHLASLYDFLGRMHIYICVKDGYRRGRKWFIDSWIPGPCIMQNEPEQETQYNNANGDGEPMIKILSELRLTPASWIEPDRAEFAYAHPAAAPSIPLVAAILLLIRPPQQSLDLEEIKRETTGAVHNAVDVPGLIHPGGCVKLEEIYSPRGGGANGGNGTWGSGRGSERGDGDTEVRDVSASERGQTMNNFVDDGQGYEADVQKTTHHVILVRFGLFSCCATLNKVRQIQPELHSQKSGRDKMGKKQMFPGSSPVTLFLDLRPQFNQNRGEDLPETTAFDSQSY
ncbi:hypothetical protein B0H10DRAFT_1966706 [Mycena sp. CBHHK59/15]|nr:hypothetical protein B0H10DRAFT_1966706 [Mycena sp. CBHHK59/15]